MNQPEPKHAKLMVSSIIHKMNVVGLSLEEMEEILILTQKRVKHYLKR